MFDYNEYLMEQEQYLEQNSFIYKYANPHPDNKKLSDCVKRAISLCSDMDYRTTQLELNRYKTVSKQATYNHNKNWLPYVEKVLKWTKLTGYNNVKVGEFAKEHPNGTYLISVRGHLTTVKNGKVLDTWNCSFKAINKVWKVS
jgi:hypothetical protein